MFSKINRVWGHIKAKRAVSGSQRCSTRLSFETLEARQLLAADLAAAIPDELSNLLDSDAALGLDQLQLDTRQYDDSRVLVRFRPDAAAEDVVSEVLVGATLGEELSVLPGMFEVMLPEAVSVTEALEAFNGNQSVLFAEANYAIKLLDTTTVPDDPALGSLWGLNQIDAPDAWSFTTGSPSTIVAVIDTGVDYTHPDLAANMWTNPGEIAGNGIDDDGNGYVDDIHGWDFRNNDADPMDDNSHGTHVAGTIAAVGNNGIGVTGVAWNVQIMALKIFDASGNSYWSDVAEALRYAVTNGAIVSNNSYGADSGSATLSSAIADARSAGHIFVAAAGNQGRDTDSQPFYPASYDYDNVISVAATDSNDNRASFSNYGAASVDLGAPGTGIYSTMPGGGYGTKSGTSMAAPHVTGAVALVASAHPDWSYRQIIDAVLDNVDPVSSLQGITVSGGRLNVANALGSRLRLSLADASLLENGESTTATLTRTGDVSQALTVTLTNSDTSELLVPSTVSFAAGESAVSFAVSTVDDDLQDGIQNVTITASASGYLDGAAALAVIDDDVPASELGLVGHFLFDETNGKLALDSAGGDNNGSLIGSAAFADDPQRGRVLSLSGNDDRVELSTPIDLGSEWTISGWYSGLANGTWKTLTRGQGGDHQILVDANGYLGSFDNSGGTGFRSSGFNMNSLSAGWHHVAAVGSGGTTTFYLDGMAVGSIAFQSVTDVFSLGNYQGGGQRFADAIDDLRVYGRGLDANEIGQLANSVPPPGDQAPMAVDDAYKTTGTQGLESVSGNVLENDNDPNGDTLTAILVDGPTSAGNFLFNADGSFTYTAQTGFVGTDSFTYKASDGSLESTVATVTITVSDVDPSLVAHWKFDEISGSSTADSAGGDNGGTLVGSATFASDASRGQVLNLSGNDDRVELDNPVELGAEWTIGGWFTGLAAGTWKTLTRGLSGDHQILVDANGYLGSFDNVAGSGFRSSGFDMNNLSAGWHHVAAVGSGSTTTFYVDGVEVGSIAFQSTSDVYCLGNYQGGGQRFADRIDDLRIYNRVLDAAEIAQLADVGPQAPVAANDLFVTPPDQPLTVTATGVLANDSDANGDSLTAMLVSGPASAAAFTFNADGSFTYTPQSGFVGSDTFTYKASDGLLESAVATVTITVSDVDTSLVAHWKFDEVSGSSTADSAGGDNGGTLVGSATFASDASRGQVLNLSGKDDRVELGNPVDLGAEWTIGGWFSGLSKGKWKTLTRGQAGDHQILVSANGELGSFDNVHGTNFRGSGFDMDSLSPGWHHVAAVGSGGTTTFYVDGVEVGSINFQSTSDVFSLGNYQGGGQRFADEIDDVRIYNRVLSAAEVAQLASANTQQAVAGLSEQATEAATSDAYFAEYQLEAITDAIRSLAEESHHRPWSTRDADDFFARWHNRDDDWQLSDRDDRKQRVALFE